MAWMGPVGSQFAVLTQRRPVRVQGGQGVRNLSQTDLSDAAVSGGGYESDKEDSDSAARERLRRPGARAAAVLGLATSPDGCAACRMCCVCSLVAASLVTACACAYV